MSRTSLTAATAFVTLAAFAGGTLLTAIAADPSANPSEPKGFAVVELFTSQGCSSCPPADRVLAEIDRWAELNDAPVYALSFHVDYWNRLGWADPYSSPQISERQREYAAAAGSNRIYTPQMIVNGEVEFVGSNGRLADQALKDALSQDIFAALAVESADGDASVTVAYEATDAPPNALVNVALVQPRGGQDVARGENAGRRLEHVNIVRAFRSMRIDPSGRGEVEVQKPTGFLGPYRVVAYLQELETKRVVAAASTSPAS